MEKLIEQPPISEEILSKTAEFLTNRYELKDFFVVQQFTEDANRVMEQFQLYSNTIHQLQTFMNGPSSHLMRKFHFNLFKVMHFLVKLVGKIGGRLQQKILPQQAVRTNQLCVNCLDSVQCRNIKNLQRELNQYIIPNYEKNYGNKETEEQYLYDEEAITSEEQLARKMTKLQRNLSDRQTSLMRCLEQFQNFRSDLMVGLKKKDQETEVFDKFDFKDYAFKLSVHFAEELVKIEQKIRRLKLTVKKQEDKAVQAIPKEGTNELQNLQKQQADNIKVISLRAETQIRKSNQAKNKMEQLAKRYFSEVKELSAKLDLLEEKNKDLKEQLFVEKLKNNAKSKNNRQNINQADIETFSKREQSEKSKEGLSIDLQSVYEEEQSLINDFSNRVMERLSEMQTVSSKLEDVLPLLKATFKRTLDNFMNQRMSSTLDRRKFFKQNNEEENVVKPRRRSHKKSMRFHMDHEFFKEISRFSPNRSQPNLKIQSQYSFKISNVGKKSSIQQNRYNQIQRVQSRFAKKLTPPGNIYKKSVLQTEGDIRKKAKNLKLNSIFSQSKQSVNHTLQDFSSDKKTSQYLTQNYSHLQMQTSMLQTGDFKQLRKSKMRRNKSQDQYILSSFSGSQEKDKENHKHITDIMHISKIQCRVIEQNIIKNFLLTEQDKMGNEDCRQTQRVKTSYKDNTTVHHAAKSQHHVKLPSNQNKSIHHQKVVFRMQELNYLTTFFTFMAKAHLTNPALYAQLKQSLFVKQRGLISEAGSKTQMMKEALGPVIFRHRKCSSQGLCLHLLDFLEEVKKLLSPEQYEMA